MRSQPPRIPQEEWVRHEATIKDLYFGQKLPLQSKTGKRSLIQVMRDEYKFSATPSQYETQFSKWDSAKNVKKSEWKLILSQLDRFRTEKIEARVKVSGRIVEKGKLRRGRNYVRADPKESCVFPPTWLTMPEFSHISIETKGEDGVWSVYMPTAGLESHQGLDLPGYQSDDSNAIFTLQDVIMAQSTDINNEGLLTDQTVMPSFNWAMLPRCISPWRTEASLSSSFRTGFQNAIEPQARDQTPLVMMNDYLLKPLPFYQFFYDLSNQSELLGSGEHLRLSFAGARSSYIPGSISKALPTSQHFIRQLLQEAAITQQDTSIWPKDTRLPKLEVVLDRLRSLLPETAQGIRTEGTSKVAERSRNFERMFLNIILYSITNGFAGFRGVPIGSIFRSLRQTQMSHKLFDYLDRCPSTIAIPLAENLLRAAVEACDVQAIRVITETMERKGSTIDLNDIVCEFQDRMYTPLELAAKLRSLQTVEILLKIGSDPNKTYEKDVSMERGPLELAMRKLSKLYDPVDADLIQALLRVGAEVRLGLLLRTARWNLDPKLQKELVERILPETHCSFFQHLPRLLDCFEINLSFQLTKQLVQFCEEENCFECIPVPPTCRNCAKNSLNHKIFQEALVTAARRANLNCCKYLLNYISADDAALSAAIRGGDRRVVDLVVEYGAGVKQGAHPVLFYEVEKDEYNDELTSPLAEAIRSRDLSLMLLVEKLGAWAFVNTNSNLVAASRACADAADTEMMARLLAETSHLKRSSLTPALTTCIRQNQKSIVSTLIAAGACVQSSGYDEAPLVVALRRRSRVAVDLILESDVDALEHDRHSHEESAMELAGLWGDISVIQDLINMGFSIDHALNTTVLATAVRVGAIDLIELLLKSGADLNASATKGISPLHEAVRTEDKSMIRLMLSKGADPADEGAFCEAIEQQRDIFVMLLFAFTDKYPCGRKGFGAGILIKAIQINDKSLLIELLTAKMDTNEFLPSYKTSPLGAAIQRLKGDNTDSIQLLLAAGADVNGIVAAPFDIGNRGYRSSSVWPRHTALLEAIETSNEKLVRLILEKGANVSQPARRGVKRTPLQKACELASLTSVRLLLDWGANVNELPARRGGGTALQLASGTGSISIIQLLLSHGANVFSPTSEVEGRSALEAAAENGCLDMLKVLWDATNGIGFQASEVERAVDFAESKGHRGCAEYIEKLHAASNQAFQECSALMQLG